MFFLVIRNSSNKRRIGGAALINFFVPDAALIRVNTVIRVAPKREVDICWSANCFRVTFRKYQEPLLFSLFSFVTNVARASKRETGDDRARAWLFAYFVFVALFLERPEICNLDFDLFAF